MKEQEQEQEQEQVWVAECRGRLGRKCPYCGDELWGSLADPKFPLGDERRFIVAHRCDDGDWFVLLTLNDDPSSPIHYDFPEPLSSIHIDDALEVGRKAFDEYADMGWLDWPDVKCVRIRNEMKRKRDELVESLKPCPFCGEKPELVSDREHVICRGCGCFPNICISVERWNTRKGEPRRCCGNCKHMSVGDRDEYDGKYYCEKHTEETGHPEEIAPDVCFSFDYLCWEAK